MAKKYDYYGQGYYEQLLSEPIPDSMFYSSADMNDYYALYRYGYTMVEYILAEYGEQTLKALI